MDEAFVRKLLDDVARGSIGPDEAYSNLRDLPFADLSVARHDAHRALRNGFSEAILCEGKSCDHLLKIVDGMRARGANVLGTRAADDRMAAISERFPEAKLDQTSRTFTLLSRPIEPLSGRLAILCAGTADLSVAEEARRTAEFFGAEATRHYDVGVAGLHRLLADIAVIRESDAVIAVAGMEGALPSVVGGMVASPIIAVPTSVGYGSSLKGITALLAMLSSCSEGIAVVGIDNGFGAACAALRIIRRKQLLR